MATIATQPLQGMKRKIDDVYNQNENEAPSQALDNRSFLEAAKSGDLESIQRLLAKGINLNTTNDEGDTALNLASSYSKLNVVKYLVEHGADIHKIDKRGDSVFHNAALADCTKIATYLVEQGAEINKPNNEGETALHLAALYGHFHIVKHLVEQCGVDTNKTNNDGETACDSVIESGDDEIATYLEHCRDYINNNRTKVVVTSQNQHLVPDYFALAVLLQDRQEMRNLLIEQSNFATQPNFSHFIKLTQRSKLNDSLHELNHLKLQLTGKKHDSIDGREAATQQGMFSILKNNSQTRDLKANFVKNI